MTELNFQLNGEEFIELSNLLKVLSLVNSGGEAKVRISHEEVKLNGEIETRKRKKLRKGDQIEFDGKIIKIDA